MAESFTKIIIDAVEAEVPPPLRRKHKRRVVRDGRNFSGLYNSMECKGGMHDDSCALIFETEPRGRR